MSLLVVKVCGLNVSIKGLKGRIRLANDRLLW